MKEVTILQGIHRIIMRKLELRNIPREIKPEMKLVEDLGVDSLDFIKLFEAIEDEFGIAPPDDLEGIKTIGDVVRYITENMLEQPLALSA